MLEEIEEVTIEAMNQTLANESAEIPSGEFEGSLITFLFAI